MSTPAASFISMSLPLSSLPLSSLLLSLQLDWQLDWQAPSEVVNNNSKILPIRLYAEFLQRGNILKRGRGGGGSCKQHQGEHWKTMLILMGGEIDTGGRDRRMPPPTPFIQPCVSKPLLCCAHEKESFNNNKKASEENAGRTITSEVHRNIKLMQCNENTEVLEGCGACTLQKRIGTFYSMIGRCWKRSCLLRTLITFASFDGSYWRLQ